MKLDRLLGILTTLLQNDRITAPVLADKFEVSRRTISRDIDALCRAGIPIVTQQGGNGGISIAEGYKLDKSVLTTDELSNLIVALKGLGSVSEDAQIKRILDKFAAASPRESVVIDLASHYKDSLTPKIQLIKQAIQANSIIEFDYYSPAGEGRRAIEPYLVAFQWTAWYLLGFCLERRDWRLFKLARLWNLKQSEAKFMPRTIPPEKLDFNARFTNNHNLIALFEPSTKYQLIEVFGPDCYTQTDEGKLRLEIDFTDRDFTLNWLRSFGDKVKVLEPADMAQEILEAAKNIISMYQ